jgi:hypothetical protein
MNKELMRLDQALRKCRDQAKAASIHTDGTPNTHAQGMWAAYSIALVIVKSLANEIDCAKCGHRKAEHFRGYTNNWCRDYACCCHEIFSDSEPFASIEIHQP